MAFIHIIQKLIIEGILPGVGSVLSFVPSIAILIFILALLRDSGIIKGPAAYFIMGFSCSVPAILACNNIEDNPRRFLTALLIPYMSCSAKLPIYMLIASTFFPAFPYAAIGAIYLIGIIMAVSAYAIGKTLIPAIFKTPLPVTPCCKGHSFPKKPLADFLRSLASEVLIYTLGFVKKAFTVVLLASIIIWLLQNLNSHLELTSQIQDSLLAELGKWISPLFSPLGFGDWRASSALITGLSAKEAVVSTFAIIVSSGEYSSMAFMLEQIFTPLSAFSFMVFCLLYMPCISSLMAIKTITKSNLLTGAFLLSHTMIAWSASFLIFHSIKVIIQYIGGV